MIDTDGTVRIAARKGDLSVTDADGKVMLLAQGQDKTLDEQSDQTDQTNDKSKKKNNKGPAWWRCTCGWWRVVGFSHCRRDRRRGNHWGNDLGAYAEQRAAQSGEPQ